LINLHAHQPLAAMLHQHDRWGPFWEFDDAGNQAMRVGKWKLSLSTKEWKAAQAAGTLPKWEDAYHFFRENFTPEKKVAAMDARGVDKLFVSVPSHWYMYWAEHEFGDRFATLVNESLAEFCSHAPDRLYFWAHANLANPIEAAKQLEAGWKLGGKGLSMGGANFGGLEINDRALYPVWEKLCEYDYPIFVHGYNQSVAWGEDADKEEFEVTSAAGMLYDETRCFWQLISGGVLDDFPELKIYITHGGGCIPYQLGRFEGINDVMNKSDKNKKPLMDYVHQFYFDTLVHAPSMRRAIVDVIGADNLLYGDNFGGSDGIREDISDNLGIPQEEREKIRWKNAARLLKLDVTAEELEAARKREMQAA